MTRMSRNYGKKLLQIRKAEKMTQKSFAELTYVALDTIKKYETGYREAGAEIVARVLEIKKFKKYTLWIMLGEVNPEAGQIEPAFSLSGSKVSEKTIQRKSCPMMGNAC